MLKSIRQPKGVFRSVNCMTPYVLGYYKLNVGYAELSEGCGLTGGQLYGVTIAPRPHPRGQSQCFQTRAAAIEYIESLS